MNPVTYIGLAVCLFITTSNAKAQIINPKKILERKANRAIEKKTEQAVDSLFDKKEKEEPQEGAKESVPVKTGNTEQKPVQDTVPSLLSYSKFDFVPGEKVIFFDDFSQDNIGDFPALWNTNGSAEIVTTNLLPGRWMKFSSREAIWTDELLKLPDNYTIEFDIIPIKGEEGRMAGYDFRLLQSINPKSYDHGAVPGKAGFLFSCEYFGRTGYRTYINSDEGADLGLSGTKEGAILPGGE